MTIVRRKYGDENEVCPVLLLSEDEKSVMFYDNSQTAFATMESGATPYDQPTLTVLSDKNIELNHRKSKPRALRVMLHDAERMLNCLYLGACNIIPHPENQDLNKQVTEAVNLYQQHEKAFFAKTKLQKYSQLEPKL